jgi:Matrixin
LRGIALVAFALLGTGAAIAGDKSAAQDTFFGFRLLDLEDQKVKWQSPRMGQSAAVTYAIATRATTTKKARNCARMLPPDRAYGPSHIEKGQFEHEVAAAFRMWEAVADITFRQIDDPDAADILIGAQADPIGRAFTNVALKPSGTGKKKVIARSLICLNPKQPWKIGFDGDLDVYDLRYTIAHEIGHAIGLDHPSPAGQLMSYRYDEKQTGPQPGDINGAALLYGPGPATPRFADGDGAGRRAGADRDTGTSGWPFGIGESTGK